MWTDNASKIDMLFYKPYAEIVSEIAIETDIDPLKKATGKAHILGFKAYSMRFTAIS